MEGLTFQQLDALEGEREAKKIEVAERLTSILAREFSMSSFG